MKQSRILTDEEKAIDREIRKLKKQDIYPEVQLFWLDTIGDGGWHDGSKPHPAICKVEGHLIEVTPIMVRVASTMRLDRDFSSSDDIPRTSIRGEIKARYRRHAAKVAKMLAGTKEEKK